MNASVTPLPALTVITVVRNALPTIRRCLDSVSGAGVQQVVVDGGSSDGTAAVIAAQTARWQWWCSEPDAGISAAFNKGLAHAQADVIGILNADDWYEPGAIDLVRRLFATTNAEVIHGRVRYWQGDKVVRIAEGDHRALTRSGSVNHPSVFVRRAVYQRLGGFDLTYRYAMDYELMLRWLVHGVRFAYLPRVIANMSLGGVSDRRRFAGLREVRRAQRQHVGRIEADIRHTHLYLRAQCRRMLDHLRLDRLIAAQRRHNRGMRTVAVES